ncbi:MAG: L,D-transpeptidase [Verrucomicrobiota bacterium]|nr:L,D-transpeptidase [Verrucomicrobiota bacterium]
MPPTAHPLAALARFHRELDARGLTATADMLYASVPEQRLHHFRNGVLLASYDISSGRLPPSCVENSNGTPDGLHCIANKIGDGAPLGMIFKSRLPIGKVYSDLEPADNIRNYVTTRILRLRGLEPGKNSGPGCDTYDRFIYIHGTNHEHLIGTPDTHGCLAMRNAEVIQLFNEVPEGSLVWIAV